MARIAFTSETTERAGKVYGRMQANTLGYDGNPTRESLEKQTLLYG